MMSAACGATSVPPSTKIPTIGHMDGGGVVDAVTQKPDGVPAAAQRTHDTAFLLWRNAREEVDLLDANRQRRL